jgi:hypothetical protein
MGAYLNAELATSLGCRDADRYRTRMRAAAYVRAVDCSQDRLVLGCSLTDVRI